MENNELPESRYFDNTFDVYISRLVSSLQSNLDTETFEKVKDLLFKEHRKRYGEFIDGLDSSMDLDIEAKEEEAYESGKEDADDAHSDWIASFEGQYCIQEEAENILEDRGYIQVMCPICCKSVENNYDGKLSCTGCRREFELKESVVNPTEKKT